MCISTQKSRAAKILKILMKRKITSVLDIGCGNGEFLSYLKETLKGNIAFYGVDISDDLVSEAKSLGFQAYRVDVSSEKLPFEDRFFDFVFMGEVIEHIYDPDNLLDEIYRILRDDGFCIITTPNLACWHNRIAILLGFQPHYTDVSTRYDHVGKVCSKPEKRSNVEYGSTHIRVFTLRALKGLLRLHHFEVSNVMGVAGTLPSPFDRIDMVFERLPSLASGLIVEFRKMPSSAKDC